MTAESICVILIASLTGIFYLLKIRSYDIYEKEPFLKLLLVSIAGGIFSVICSFVIYEFVEVRENFTDSILKIGTIEEFSKLLALVAVFPLIRKEFNEIVDGIIYITAIALGFSVIENILYSIGSEEPYNLLFKRSIFSVLGHVSFSGYMGIAYYIHKKIRNNIPGILLSLSIAASAHGFYDGVLFTRALNSMFILVFSGLLLLQFRFLKTTLSFSTFRKTISTDTFKLTNEKTVINCCRCNKNQVSMVYKFSDIKAGLCNSCNNMLFDYRNTRKLYRYFRPAILENPLKRLSQKGIIHIDEEKKILYDPQKKTLSGDIDSLGKWFEKNNETDKNKILGLPLTGFILRQIGLKYLAETRISSEENKINIPA
jgi:RsiW-degrading membrane proteinase PrsW (M82 family)